MNKGDIFTLSDIEQQIVELVSKARQDNKEATNVKNKPTIPKADTYILQNKIDNNLHKIGFGAEFIFCREHNLFPDFWIGNYSKNKGTDPYDAILNGMSVDVKSSSAKSGDMKPLMIPSYTKNKCDIFAYFHCIYPRYRFAGYATNEMLYNNMNLRHTKVLSYVLELHHLL